MIQWCTNSAVVVAKKTAVVLVHTNPTQTNVAIPTASLKQLKHHFFQDSTQQPWLLQPNQTIKTMLRHLSIYKTKPITQFCLRKKKKNIPPKTSLHRLTKVVSSLEHGNQSLPLPRLIDLSSKSALLSHHFGNRF